MPAGTLAFSHDGGRGGGPRAVYRTSRRLPGGPPAAANSSRGYAEVGFAPTALSTGARPRRQLWRKKLKRARHSAKAPGSL